MKPAKSPHGKRVRTPVVETVAQTAVAEASAPVTRAAQNRSAQYDALIRRVAAGQHGVAERGQLIAAGVPPHLIDYRLRTHRLEMLHRGVYRIGPVRSPYECEAAALLACGDGAVLSHQTAAALWDIRRSREERPVEVIIRRGYRVRGAAVRVHRIATLCPDEIAMFEGLPITTPARTLLDLAPRLAERELEQAVARAERNGLADRARVDALLVRYPRRAGTRVLRALFGAGTPAFTRSEAESRFLLLIRRAGLPKPEVNMRVLRYEVDFLWRTEQVVVEIDGAAYHSDRNTFESDRIRDATLQIAGFRVIRVTWKQLTSHPEAVLVCITRALG
jgi:very-short-patch-repair endonuclease